MKVTTIILSLGMLCLAIQASIPTATAASNIDEILTNLERATNSITTLRADLHQETSYSLIGGRIVQSGKLYIDRVNKLFSNELIIKYADGSVVSIKGGKVTVYRGRLVPTKGAQLKNDGISDFKLLFLASQYNATASKIKEQYSVSYIKDEQEGETSTTILELSPRDKSSIQKIKLWVDEKSWLPVKLETTHNDGDQSTVTLTQIETGIDVKNEILMYLLK